MIKHIIECNGCGKSVISLPQSIGPSSTYDWISVRRGASTSEDRISAGESLFCSEACLATKLTRPKPVG